LKDGGLKEVGDVDLLFETIEDENEGGGLFEGLKGPGRDLSFRSCIFLTAFCRASLITWYDDNGDVYLKRITTYG
jgi:hypothetical protein